MRPEVAAETARKEKELKLVTDTELLARFYGNEDELDHKEKFLRSYILNEGWKETAKKGASHNRLTNHHEEPVADATAALVERQGAVDNEDEKRDDEMDNFESKYNFRFEEPNAATITSHARDANAEETMRRKDSTRKLARDRAKDKKEDLKK